MNKGDIIQLALDIIYDEEFDLVVEDKVFKLEDCQCANLGGIEQDEFYNLKDVLNRMDAYHEDYFIFDYEDLKEDGCEISEFEETAYKLLTHDCPDEWWKILEETTPEDLRRYQNGQKNGNS